MTPAQRRRLEFIILELLETWLSTLGDALHDCRRASRQMRRDQGDTIDVDGSRANG